MRILLADYKDENGQGGITKYKHPEQDRRGVEKLVYDYADHFKRRGLTLIALAELETDESGHEIYKVLNRIYYDVRVAN